MAVHADIPAILQLWDEQDERFQETGVKVDRPTLFYEEHETDRAYFPYRPPVVRVAVAEKDGVIVGFRYTECIPEVCIVTGDKDVMDTLGAELTREAHWAKQQGFRSGWGLVPAKFSKAIARFLRRFPHIRAWTTLTPIGIDFSELGD
jgi:hypothetical protein